jgi:hypothetical protein
VLYVQKACPNSTMPRINRSSTEIVTTASIAEAPSSELRPEGSLTFIAGVLLSSRSECRGFPATAPAG